MSKEPTVATRSTHSEARGWVISLSGATAALVVAGFIVRESHNHLLGVPFYSGFAVDEYAIEGASFAFACTVRLLARPEVLLTGLSLTIIFLTAAVIFVRSVGSRAAAKSKVAVTQRRRDDLLQWLQLVLLVAALACQVTEVYRNDFPAVFFRDVLLYAPEISQPPNISIPKFLEARAKRLYQDLACSHISATWSDKTAACSATGTSNYSQLRDRLDALFAANVAETLAALMPLFLLLRKQRDAAVPLSRHQINSLYVLRVIFLVVGAINITLLPFTYAKVASAPVAPLVSVHFSLRIKGPYDLEAKSRRYARAEGYHIRSSKETIQLYRLYDRDVWTISSDVVRLVVRAGTDGSDVLSAHFGQLANQGD